jgi:hypothetical protein
VDKELMFYCIPQQAYMRTANCEKLRNRPTGKVPAGSQPKLRACETCAMYPLVDALRVPTVSVVDYLAGVRPDQANLESGPARKLMAGEAQRKAG